MRPFQFNVVRGFWAGEHDLYSTAKVFIEKIQINAHFFEEEELEADIDPGEFNGLPDHEILIDYLKKLSRLLNNPVDIMPENEHHIKLLTVNKDEIYLNI